MSYVVSHSNRDLATFFKVVALWSGRKVRCCFLVLPAVHLHFLVLVAYRNKHGELMPYVGTILAGVQLFFLTISNLSRARLNRLPIADLQRIGYFAKA